MKISGNTILITGGGSGIGRALAEALHAKGNQVILAGRRKDVLEKVTAANPGMKSVVVDVQDLQGLKGFAEKLAADFPALNVLLNNAGIMKPEDVLNLNTEVIEATVATNLLAPMVLTGALLPLLKQQPSATVITVSSGLAYTPLAMTPTYCATKAAIHSYSQSLRYQLKDTSVEVKELVPPYVQTELMGEQQAVDPNAMPLKEFIDEVMSILESEPTGTEICVQRVYPLRYAAELGREKYDAFVTGFNDRMMAANHGR